MIVKALADTLIDSLKLLPFLFLTYLIMEYIEHKAGGGMQRVIQQAGKCGPVLGGILGVVPQCGFSAAASSLYAGRIITLGTLLSVFLSTSDEMLPILISEHASIAVIGGILAMKVFVGIVAGFIVDALLRKKHKKGEEELRIEHICDHDHCHCGEGRILRSAVRHTLQIFAFLLLISFLLNVIIGLAGEDALSSFMTASPILGPVLSGLVGLIPNCAASVIITELYLSGVLGTGAMLSGLLAGTGVGLLILFRVNDKTSENIKITALLYGIGAAVGILIEMTGII